MIMKESQKVIEQRNNYQQNKVKTLIKLVKHRI